MSSEGTPVQYDSPTYHKCVLDNLDPTPNPTPHIHTSPTLCTGKVGDKESIKLVRDSEIRDSEIRDYLAVSDIHVGIFSVIPFQS